MGESTLMSTQSGVAIGIERFGQGPPVVLLGGLGMPAVVWELSGLTAELADSGFEVVAMTMRGVPPSSAPPAPYAVEDLADDVVAVLDGLGAESNVIVVGYSLGAFVAQALLRRQPTRFHGVVFVAGLNPSPLVEVVDTMELGLLDEFGTLPRSVSAFELLMTTLPAPMIQDGASMSTWHSVFADDSTRWAGPDGLRGQLSASRDWVRGRDQHLEELRDIAVPALSIAFEHDLFFPPENEKAAARRIPGCEQIVVADAAHGGLSTHPTVPVEHIVSFCRSRFQHT